mmetsp:Transcript_25504/g.71725  ORF Transcript_25504/g.71725 Transcript_25504/m.71725 type:complete len:234 (-) Transcript_25504:702-1403(-)
MVRRRPPFILGIPARRAVGEVAARAAAAGHAARQRQQRAGVHGVRAAPQIPAPKPLLDVAPEIYQTGAVVGHQPAVVQSIDAVRGAPRVREFVEVALRHVRVVADHGRARRPAPQVLGVPSFCVRPRRLELGAPSCGFWAAEGHRVVRPDVDFVHSQSASIAYSVHAQAVDARRLAGPGRVAPDRGVVRPQHVVDPDVVDHPRPVERDVDLVPAPQSRFVEERRPRRAAAGAS